MKYKILLVLSTLMYPLLAQDTQEQKISDAQEFVIPKKHKKHQSRAKLQEKILDTANNILCTTNKDLKKELKNLCAQNLALTKQELCRLCTIQETALDAVQKVIDDTASTQELEKLTAQLEKVSSSALILSGE